MTRALIPALALACATISSSVLGTSAIAQDARLVERMYDPAEVVRIDGRTKVQATIAFEDDERIENVAIGDSQAWQVTPNKRANLLFIKPLSTTARTNMTVVTDRRTYLFDLIASAKAKPLYVLRFTYPPEPEKEAPALAGSANAVELAAARDPYAVVDPAQLNFEWAKKGDKNLMPTRTYDDGNATFLTWPDGKSVPAILIKDHEGTEGPVNFAVRGNMIVVDGVPAEIILRSGDDLATLINNGPPRPVVTSPSSVFAQIEGS